MLYSNSLQFWIERTNMFWFFLTLCTFICCWCCSYNYFGVSSQVFVRASVIGEQSFWSDRGWGYRVDHTLIQKHFL